MYNNDFMNSKWVEYMPEGHVLLRNVMFAPLNLEGKTVGLANKPSDFTDDDAEIATVFGDIAASHWLTVGTWTSSERRIY
ncbi:MAG: GAF domain-containing protein [Desulfobacterales bacterium]|nr:GAF domain-containing protein [Desulfobacterales bacterium]